jgi:hypothetical protein
MTCHGTKQETKSLHALPTGLYVSWTCDCSLAYLGVLEGLRHVPVEEARFYACAIVRLCEETLAGGKYRL